MKMNIKVRLVAFATLIVLLTLMIAWAAHLGWRQFQQLRARFKSTPIESFRSADQFRATLQQLDYLLLRYNVKHDEADWKKFDTDRRKLDHWIDDQALILTTPQERKLLQQINDVYDDYQAAALRLHPASGGGQNTEPSGVQHAMRENSRTNTLDDRNVEASLSPFEHLENQSHRLRDLSFQLADAHQESLKLFVAGAGRSLVLLRALIFGALFALLVLAAWVAIVVYRDMIAPLRHQLVESHAIIERQEKLASLGVLAAGVAHEIRNPLTAIKARLFLQQKLLRPGSEEAEDAAIIGNEINRLERIVRDVLQFARPADPNLAAIPVDAPLKDVQKLMGVPLEKHRIVLKLGEVADARVLADSQQIKQVLINLVQNAAESIEQNGCVTLSARTSSSRLRGEVRSVVIIEVSDTGKGMPTEVQKRLFDPFFSTKEKGTGLGLAIAARIVEKHGGALEFQTQVGHGTVFGIVLEQANPAERAPKTAIPTREPAEAVPSIV